MRWSPPWLWYGSYPFRARSPTVIAKLREKFPDLPEQLDTETVFLKLRELRNSW